MPGYKRSRSRSVDFSRAVKTARKTGTMGPVSRARRARSYYKLRPRSLLATKVNNLYKMIETKESARKSDVNIALPHNNVYVVSGPGGTVNIFHTGQGTADPMDAPSGINRIGDAISVKGVMIRGFFENALARPRVFYRVMLIKAAKGDTIDRTTLFKGDSGNKMIDQVNTERFTIIAQKIFTINASNVAASGAEANGAPLIATAGGVGTRTMKMWIPGYKFGKNGNVQYENGSATQLKFYDYKIVVLAYDWYGTPQDVNNVGRINELYSKLYFKDA
jgi:hypothetical protein